MAEVGLIVGERGGLPWTSALNRSCAPGDFPSVGARPSPTELSKKMSGASAVPDCARCNGDSEGDSHGDGDMAGEGSGNPAPGLIEPGTAGWALATVARGRTRATAAMLIDSSLGETARADMLALVVELSGEPTARLFDLAFDCAGELLLARLLELAMERVGEQSGEGCPPCSDSALEMDAVSEVAVGGRTMRPCPDATLRMYGQYRIGRTARGRPRRSSWSTGSRSDISQRGTRGRRSAEVRECRAVEAETPPSSSCGSCAPEG